MIGLGTLADSGESYAKAASSDGSVVVGYSSAPEGTLAFRWARAEGMVSLGAIPGQPPVSYANAISSDGSIVVGESDTTQGMEACRWNLPSGELDRLGHLPGGPPNTNHSWGTGVSSDGSIVVGRSLSALGEEAFVWSEANGMINIGDLPGGRVFADPQDVSADGSIIVGRSAANLSTTEAFIWDADNGMRNLKDVLTNEYGLDMSGWTLMEGRAISDDGRVIVGAGRYDPTWEYQAWMAVLPAPTLESRIDIRPGSDINPVNLTSQGVLPVAVYGTEDFDVEQIDLSSLAMEGTGPNQKGKSGTVASVEDIDGDSWLDLVLHFDIQNLNIGATTEQLILSGVLLDGTAFEGADSIRIVPPGDVNGDLVVDIIDLTAMAGNWSALSPGAKSWAQGDCNGDSTVDILDLTALAANWGAETIVIPGGPVPEPTALVLLAIGGLALIRRRLK